MLGMGTMERFCLEIKIVIQVNLNPGNVNYKTIDDID